MLIGLGIIGGLAVVAIGAWAYVVSNVKQPSYVSVTLDGAIEVRDYPALVVADRHDAGRHGREALQERGCVGGCGRGLWPSSVR